MHALTPLLALLLCVPGLAAAEDAPAAEQTPQAAVGRRTGELTRGKIRAVVRAWGTVRPEEFIRLTAPIDGRIEEVLVSSGVWVEAKKDLVRMVSRDMAAMVDSRGSVSGTVLEDRWQRVYRPSSVRCPFLCFVTRVFNRPKTMVPAGSALIEAARKLRLVGNVRQGDSAFVRKGQILVFWDRRRPEKRFQARVEDFRLDVVGQKVAPNATLSALQEPGYSLPPGTDWEGEIVALERREALRVPTDALLRYGDELYLPVRVSTGITTYEYTEIVAGASARQRFLYLDPSRMGGTTVYEPAATAPPPARREPPPKAAARRSADETPPMEAPPAAAESGNPNFVSPEGEEYPSDYESE